MMKKYFSILGYFPVRVWITHKKNPFKRYPTRRKCIKPNYSSRNRNSLQNQKEMALKSIKRLILQIDGASIKLENFSLSVLNQFHVRRRSKYATYEIFLPNFFREKWRGAYRLSIKCSTLLIPRLFLSSLWSSQVH
jgi:hypothetical protein